MSMAGDDAAGAAQAAHCLLFTLPDEAPRHCSLPVDTGSVRVIVRFEAHWGDCAGISVLYTGHTLP
jgi:hypothetical protein